MSFESLLNTTCNIYARVFTQDADTGEQQDSLQLLSADVPCRYYDGVGNFNRNARLQTASNSDRIYFLPLPYELKKNTHIIEVKGKQFSVDEHTDMGAAGKYWKVNLTRIAQDD